ncbi:MAG: hypothetical protein II649_04365 [Kiritimatiellae bacterium]|nr:hypothetical protein [Kiritimatiellia bacterium]
MKRIMLAGLVFVLAGCGSGPSNKEIAQGMIRMFSRETGISSANLKARAKKIGNGRWTVAMEVERYDGQRRTLNATAVVDKNGGIHYYTD